MVVDLWSKTLSKIYGGGYPPTKICMGGYTPLKILWGHRKFGGVAPTIERGGVNDPIVSPLRNRLKNDFIKN